ncbi:hypothetical protein BDP27DRAFT_710288 [Rhodocollybia butyracea]|uniref:Uncharacterized protein n=1 Tax=Rhodocollybia butyracea TaxID=206335 RepID=A0A9P5UF71_9AGAR|nr:hypothetical protein BDP27DRAFT_710288 [Rhodocollybia butyracea]
MSCWMFWRTDATSSGWTEAGPDSVRSLSCNPGISTATRGMKPQEEQRGMGAVQKLLGAEGVSSIVQIQSYLYSDHSIVGIRHVCGAIHVTGVPTIPKWDHVGYTTQVHGRLSLEYHPSFASIPKESHQVSCCLTCKMIHACSASFNFFPLHICTTQSTRSGAVAINVCSTLPSFDIAYETWYSLSRRDNIIILHTGLSASSHAASTSLNSAAEWWEKFLGPSKALDMNQFFIICTRINSCLYHLASPPTLSSSTAHKTSHSKSHPPPVNPPLHLTDLAEGMRPLSSIPILVLRVQSDILSTVEQQRDGCATNGRKRTSVVL